MADFDCTTDPTIVACTGEDIGRAYDLPVTTEVGTVAPDPVLAATGVPVPGYLAVVLLLVLAGRGLMLWARRGV